MIKRLIFDVDGTVVSRIDLTRNAFIMALIKHINGEIWK